MLKKDFNITCPLGEGIYGHSARCRNNKIKNELVMNEISLSSLAKLEKEDILEEFEMYPKINHPNIVKYHHCFLDKNSLCLITDYNDGSSLKDTLRRSATNYFDEDTILSWFIQLCFAVKYAHDRNILHRNIHLSNVILTHHGSVKLYGFTFAKLLDHSSDFPNANIGTPYNLCPETCLGLQYTAKSDVWSLGLLLYQICTLQWSQFSPTVSNAVLGGDVKIPRIYSQNMQTLVSCLLERDQNKRPSINKVLRYHFLKEAMEKLLKTFVSRLELTKPARERSNSMINNGGYGGGSKCGRPNLGRPNLGGAGNKSKGNKGDDKKIKERFLSKKPSIKQPKSSTSAFSTAKRVPKKQKVADLSIQAMGVDPASFNVHKPQQKYDVLQSKSTTETSELVLESSCASKEEFYELRKKELKQRQKEKEAERMQRMQELQLEAKKRLKEFDQMEAPFKKIREKSKDAKKSEFVEDLLYLAIEAAKPAPVGPIRNYSAEDRERETNLLVDLINQKREEVQHTKKLQELDDDVIVIGNVQVPVEQPKTFKKQTSGSSTARSHAPPLQEIPLNENNDLIAIAAVSKNTLNIPPEDSENGIKSNEKSHETGLFYFNGLPIDIPGVDSITCLERADCLIQFIEQGLGPEMLQEAKDFLLVAPKMDEKEAETKFREVFSNPEEMKYYPFVQHLLFCENFKQTTQLPKPSHYSATNEEEEEDQLQQNQENQENGEFEEEEQQQEFEEEEEEGIEKDE